MSDIRKVIGQRFVTDTYVDREAYEMLTVARARLLARHPFWGVVGIDLTLVEETSGGLSTLATDGKHIFYNAEFIKKVGQEAVLFCYVHELYHCLFHHSGSPDRSRKKDRDPHLWNLAGDYMINLDVKQAEIGQFPDESIIKVCYDEKFDKMSTEEIYEKLAKNPEQHQNQQTLDLHIEIQVGEGDGGDQKKGKKGGKKGGDQSGDGESGQGNSQTITVTMDPEEYEEFSKKWQKSMQQAEAAHREAEMRGQAAGSIPRGVQRMLDELRRPKIDWTRVLRNFSRNILKRAYSFKRPSKTNLNSRVVIPGFRSPVKRLEIHTAFDASGSVDREQFTIMVSELMGIMESHQDYKITAWCFDGDVIEESVTEITKTGSSTLRDLEKFMKRTKGGGGTSFINNWYWMKRNKIKPKGLIVFTDGYPFGPWGDPLYCPTMFLLVGNDERIQAPFGITAHYEDAA